MFGHRHINCIAYISQNIIGTNFLTKFHEDRKINVASRVLTRKYAPPPDSHVFQPTGIFFKIFHEDRTEKCPAPWKTFVQANIIIFELIQDIIETNLLTKFHEVRTINVASTKTIFELIQDIIGTNLLTKFHDDRKINVTSTVLTRKIVPPQWWPCFSTNWHHF
ncbi:hypothetical protein DPMN_044280 [Dreissena polymorpha]|uniref:Uncharacterized protein n=1 Tax=Dreissena polymorpha TaxID=45954 RepID=A0A9D4D2N4_DREPO|nr:hypothetical protein DPMN_044280 [Dreissena polymorpha]